MSKTEIFLIASAAVFSAAAFILLAAWALDCEFDHQDAVNKSAIEARK